MTVLALKEYLTSLLTRININTVKPVNRVKLMTVWRGGRGVKAPYETTHVRIPVAIKEQVENLSKAYKDGSFQDSEVLSFDEAVELARKIVKQKKSARTSLQSLLTSLYKKDVCL